MDWASDRCRTFPIANQPLASKYRHLFAPQILENYTEQNIKQRVKSWLRELK